MSTSILQRLAPTLLIAAVLALSGCASTYTYKKAHTQQLDAVCSSSESTESELLMEDPCGSKLSRMTGEAACEAGNGLGCAVASMLALESVGVSEALNQPGLASTGSSAYTFARRGCQLQNETSCMLQVQMLLQSDSQRENAQGFNLMDRQCTMREMGAICNMLGSIFEEHATNAREKREGLDYYKRGCQADDADACFGLAGLHEKGWGTSTNLSRAKELYHQACDLSHFEACEQVDRDPPKDEEELLAQWARITTESYVEMSLDGCKNGFRHGCTFAGRLIARGEVRSRYVGDQQALELFRAGCDQGAPESCYHLAQMVHHGQGVEANTKTAAQLALKGCKGGMDDSCTLHRDYEYRLLDEKAAEAHATACGDETAQRRGRQCYLAGQAFAYDVNFTADIERARELHLEGCALDYADSCQAAAKLFDPGQSEGDDLQRAQKLYEKACSLDAAEACHLLGMHHREGTQAGEGGIDEDIELATRYLERGCEGRWGESCGQLGSIYEEGEAVEEDEALAEKMYRLGCASGHLPSCTNLAQFYLATDTEESVSQSVQLFYYACANDEPEACGDLGLLLSNVEDEEMQAEAAEHLEKACMLDSGYGCHNFASIHYHGTGVDEDVDKAASLYQRACDEGFAPSCFEMGLLYRDGDGVEADAATAVEHFQDSCDEDFAPACQVLASMKLEGNGTDYAPEEALALLEQACELGGDDACVSASRVVTYGVHVPQSLERAVEFLETGCEAEGPASCDDLADRVRLGIGAKADPARADTHAEQSLELNRQRCESDDPGQCAYVAHQIAHGRGPDTDFSAARDFLRQQCEDEENDAACREIAKQKSNGEIFPRNRDAGVQELLELCKEYDYEYHQACYEAAYYMRHAESDELQLTRSVDLYQRLCDDEHSLACHHVGTAYLHGLGVDADTTRAVNILAETCTDTESFGCLSYMEALLRRGDVEKFQPLYERSQRACANNDAAACLRQGEMLAYGVGVGQDMEAAGQAFEQACNIEDGSACARSDAFDSHADTLAQPNSSALKQRCEQGEANACVGLGLILEYGVGTRDPNERAARLYEKACEENSKLGCQLRVAMDDQHKMPLVGDDTYRYVSRACELGSGRYCFSTGRYFANQDWKKGVEMVSRACEEGMDQACLWLTANGEPVE